MAKNLFFVHTKLLTLRKIFVPKKNYFTRKKNQQTQIVTNPITQIVTKLKKKVVKKNQISNFHNTKIFKFLTLKNSNCD